MKMNLYIPEKYNSINWYLPVEWELEGFYFGIKKYEGNCFYSFDEINEKFRRRNEVLSCHHEWEEFGLLNKRFGLKCKKCGLYLYPEKS